MKKFFVCGLVLLLVCTVVASQQPDAPAWNVTLLTNTVANSDLTVVNRCRRSHQFQIQVQNAPFLQLSANQASVSGAQTKVLPVKFDTRNLAPGVYHGAVVVICLSCSKEPTCTQDREVLQVILTVTDPPQGQPPGPSNASTSDAPSTSQPSSPTSGTSGQQSDGPPITAISTSEEKDPCREDCEKLRLLAEQKGAAAAAAQSVADKMKTGADQAERAAKDADDAAAKAARAAQPDTANGKITVDGEIFDQADSEWLDAKREALFGEWQAGRISAEEQQRQRAELSGADALRKAREERLAKAAELKQAAENAKADADKARDAAETAQTEAAAAQHSSEVARNEAADARKKYDECLKEVEDECRRVAEAKAAADARAAAEAAADKRARKEDEERRRNEDAARAKAASDHEYLLDNIKKLGLITYRPKANLKVPGALDYVFDPLRKLAGQTVTDFLQTVAGQIGGGPIPTETINALGELYKAMGSFFDIRTAGGKRTAYNKLLKMINPRANPPRRYTHDEALDKIDRMEKLMRELRDKLGQALDQAKANR